MSIEITKYDQLNIKINLWKNSKFDYFLPKDKQGNIIPFPKQLEAWNIIKSRKIKAFAYGGASGGAKTHTDATAMIMEHLSIPGLHSAVCRKELKDLMNTTYVSFLDAFKMYGIPVGKEHGIVHYNEKKNYWKFNNGSIIYFLAVAHQPSDPTYEWLGSYMLSYAWLEEAQQIDFQAYVKLSQRVGRQIELYKKIGYVINQILITMNPAKKWVYNLFYLPSMDGTLAEDKLFMRALARDNPTLPPEYHKQLDEIPDPIERAKQRDGVWEYDDSRTAIFKYNNITRMFDDEPFETFGEYFITCDPARKGKDEAVIMVWDGYRVFEIHIAKKCKTTDIEDRIMQIQAEHRIPNENVIIDSNGVGGGVNDHIDGSFEFISHSKPIIDFAMAERASAENPSPFASLRDQVFWIASDLVNKNIPVFSSAVKIERFGEYTDLYTREDIKKEFRKEIEQICKETEDSDKKIKLTKKHEIANIIGRSTNFSDCWSMRFVLDCGNESQSQQFCIGVVPESQSDENYYYRKLQEAV